MGFSLFVRYRAGNPVQVPMSAAKYVDRAAYDTDTGQYSSHFLNGCRLFEDDSAPMSLIVVQNWFDELTRLVRGNQNPR